ncbi:hypothetical protein [Aeromonas veronii]|uniref:hypothetical protein n=1 Tax=Aeromonas veronii TaxID=654 RepID=UPI003D19C8A1
MERHRNPAGDAGRSHAGAIEQSKPAVTTATSPFGQSITDACLSWSDTETLLAMLAEAAQVRLSKQA